MTAATISLLLQTIPYVEPLAPLGIAGVMGGLWLKERLLSQKRDTELSQAHNRMMQERIEIEALVALVRKNTTMLHRLVRTQEHLIRQIRTRHHQPRSKRQD